MFPRRSGFCRASSGKKSGFKSETRLVKRRTSTNLAPVDRVELYIPPADLEAWGRIRAEFFPV